MNPHYTSVAQRAGHRCEYCRAPEAIFNFPFEVEHVTPLTRDGPDDESNRALSCRACNLHKSNHLEFDDPDTRRPARLFHPRRDNWEDHFRVEIESGVIVGMTPEGRATVSCLRMNSDVQLAARRSWAQLGLFP
jgi:hypothetical protein